MNYRPATAADVGRTDWQVSDDGKSWERYRGKLGKFARVPILPGECSHEWDRDGERCVKCGDKDWMTAVHSNPPVHCAMNKGEPMSSDEQIKKFTIGEPRESETDPHYKQVTIRRKLEAGGYAEAEQAILLDGRYYALDWIKSGVGVLPEQCEIV